jgi:hypothetical protein
MGVPAPPQPTSDDQVQLSSRKSSIDGNTPQVSIATQYEQYKLEFEQLLQELLSNREKNKKNVGTIDNLLP